MHRITSSVGFCVLALTSSAVAQDSGWQAFERNDVAAASTWADQALAQDAANQRAHHLRILTSFLSGQFEEALSDYEQLAADYSGRNESLVRLVLDAYLHLERYSDAARFARTVEVAEAERMWLDERAAHPPTVQLDGTTIVPFAAANFLGDLMPAVEVELNGIPLVAHLDTGGSFVTMAPDRARELGIETREMGTGVANNERTSLRRGLAETLILGDAHFTNVQVTTVESLTGQLGSLVILGTRILSNFLMTWDNERGRLILTERDDDTARAAHLMEHTRGVEGVHFYLHSGHYIWVNGSVMDREALMFLDTGLVTLDPSGQQPAGGIPASLLDVWDLAYVDGFTGPVLVSVGPVSREVSSFSVFPDRRNLPRLENTGPDIPLSHGFLKHFVWTLDFDDYRLYVRPVTP
ncbi:MAG: retropepsin-like aspartic protease [Vicinamibacterales bacterium]